jgi:hypothetical protein
VRTLTISYGALGTVNGTAKLIACVTVGILWTAVLPTFAFLLAALLMASGTLSFTRLKAY